jgi:TRAP-type C4-dicarboxylate transport system substrate-binding protein
MSPAEAKAQYEALSPDQKKAVKQAAEQAKEQYGNDPGMKEQLKALYKSWKGGQ